MKDVKKILNICSLALVLFTLASCSNYYSGKNTDPVNDDPGLGLVRLYFEIPESEFSDGPDSSALKSLSRTMLPVSSTNFRYDLKFSNADSGIIDKTYPATGIDTDGITILIDGKPEIPLAVGTWTIEVTRKEIMDGGLTYNPVAYGSAIITVNTGPNEKEIILSPIENGTGFFGCTINLSASSSFITSVKGEISVKSVKNKWVDTKDINSFPSEITWPELDAGEYDVTVFLTNTANNTKTGDHSVVHVYTGMKTSGAFTFSEGHFVSYVPLAGTVDNTKNFAGVNPASVKITAHDPDNGTVIITDTPPETYPWDGSAIPWQLSIDPNIPSVYFTLDVTATNGNVYTYEMKDTPETGIGVNGRQGISLAPYIYSITPITSSDYPGANSSVTAWKGAESRTAASPGEPLTLTVQSDYGMKQGSLNYRIGAVDTPVTGSPYSFVMPGGAEAGVSFNAVFYSAELSGLTVTPIKGSLSFSPGTYEYDVAVDNSVSAISVSGTSSEGAAVSVSGPYNDLLTTAPNEITITVTPPNPAGTVLKSPASRDYTLIVTRDKSAVCDLASLTVSKDVTSPSLPLSPVFSSGQTSYTVNVGYDVTSIYIGAVPVKLPPESTMEGDTGDQPLSNVGVYNFSIKVTAEDGTTTKTYNITVNRADPLSTENRLSSLGLSSGGWTWGSTEFNSDIDSYNISVANDISSVTVTATQIDPKASVLGDGAPPLGVGQNQVKIYVTPESGTPVKTYILNITRRGIDTLASLSTSDGLDQTFNSSVTGGYTVTVYVNSITVIATATDSGATVEGTGLHNNLDPGTNTIEIDVIPQHGTQDDKNTYTITVTYDDVS